MTKAGPKSVARAPRVPFAILVVALVVGAMAALLALNTASAANELNRHDLAVQDTDLAAQLEQLQNEVAASAAPGNLASVAAALGMVPAANPAFLQIGVDGKVILLGSPAPASALVIAPPPTPTASPKKTPTPTTSKSVAKTTAKTSAHPTPTPTPNPTTTLPGGTR